MASCLDKQTYLQRWNCFDLQWDPLGETSETLQTVVRDHWSSFPRSWLLVLVSRTLANVQGCMLGSPAAYTSFRRSFSLWHRSVGTEQRQEELPGWAGTISFLISFLVLVSVIQFSHAAGASGSSFMHTDFCGIVLWGSVFPSLFTLNPQPRFSFSFISLSLNQEHMPLLDTSGFRWQRKVSKGFRLATKGFRWYLMVLKVPTSFSSRSRFSLWPLSVSQAYCFHHLQRRVVNPAIWQIFIMWYNGTR